MVAVVWYFNTSLTYADNDIKNRFKGTHNHVLFNALFSDAWWSWWSWWFWWLMLDAWCLMVHAWCLDVDRNFGQLTHMYGTILFLHHSFHMSMNAFSLNWLLVFFRCYENCHCSHSADIFFMGVGCILKRDSFWGNYFLLSIIGSW